MSGRRRAWRPRGPCGAFPTRTAGIRCATVGLVLAGWPAGASAQAGPIDRTWPVAERRHVSIRAPDASVRVEVWDRAEIRVRMEDPEARHRLGISDAPGSVLEIQVQPDGPAAPGRGDADTVFVTIPRHSPLSVRTYRGAVSIAGGDGDIEADAYFETIEYRGAARRVTAKGFRGDIAIDAPDARLVVVESGGGDARVETAGGDVRVETVRGDIDVRARDPLERVDLRSNAGSVALSASLTADATVMLDSHHGSLDLGLDPATGARFRLETWLGAIENDLGPSASAPRHGRARANRVEFNLGPGGALVTASTYRGDIRLHGRR